jgi:DNA-binding response OmpR family regulator
LGLNNELDAAAGTENSLLLESGIGEVGMAKPGYPYKILVVDDEEDIILTVKTILNEAGYCVDAFTDPSAAFNMFRPEEYEIIILDIRMPGLNGFELYMKLFEKDSTIKVLFLTAVNEFSVYEKYKNNVSPMFGKRYYLQKPIEFTKLLQRVDEMLNL